MKLAPPKKKKREISYMDCYIVLTFVSLLFLFFYVFFTQGMRLEYFLWSDEIDTGMDFFNSIIYTKGRHPYTQYGTIYPPLANLFFWILSHCIPPEIKSQWAESYETALLMRGTIYDPRLKQSELMLFLIVVIVISLFFVLVVGLYYNKTYYGILAGTVFLFSYGSLYALERGNIITLSLISLFIFLKYYQSDNHKLREVAFWALAVSAGLKLYPALFGILLLYEKNIKETLKTVLYGILLFLVPFSMFDGFKGMKSFVYALVDFSNKNTPIQSLLCYSLQGVIRSVLAQFVTLLGIDAHGVVNHSYRILVIIVLGSLCLGLFVQRKKWKQILIIGLLIVLIQDSVGYTLEFLLPALLFFGLEEKISRKTMGYFVLLMLIHIPWPIMGAVKGYINYITIIQQDAMAILIMILLADIYLSIYKKIKNKASTLYYFKKEKLNV